MSEYVIAKYIRLSLDEAVTESMSIPHQRMILDDHIEGLDIPNATVLEFVDNGHSGTNMERPAVQELLELARSGSVNCIVIKDFSRFSRNSLDSEYFIAQVFPLYRIRFISISDNFDSEEYKNDTGGIDVAFKFLMHEYYSADLSKKVKSAKRIQMVRGESIVANAIYGYRKNNQGVWEPDPEAADIVRLIYRMALEGDAPPAIRDRLFEMGYPTPREYVEMKRGKGIIPGCRWEARAVTRMLTNEQYIGTYISGKQENKAIGSHSKNWLDKSEWITIPDRHPPLVSKEDFAKVQDFMDEYRKGHTLNLTPKQSSPNDTRSPQRPIMERGDFIAAFPIYGYAKKADGKWEPDQRTSGIIRQIFLMAIDGTTPAEIAAKLTSDGHPTPSAQLDLDRGKDITPMKPWNAKSVTSLLRNIQYAGAYVSGKILSKLDGTGADYHTKKEDWIIIPNRHPPIVSEAEYAAAQESLNHWQSGKRKMNSRDYLLKGKARCGCCGYALMYDTTSDPVFRCYHTAADQDAECHKMKVIVRELDEAVLAIVKKQAEVVLNSADLSDIRKKSMDARYIADCEKKIRECVEQRQRNYERFVLREIDREAHQALKVECAAQIEKLNSRLAVLRQAERDKLAAKKAADIAKQIINEPATPRDIVDMIVDRVLVFPGNQIEVQWKIADFACIGNLEIMKNAV